MGIDTSIYNRLQQPVALQSQYEIEAGAEKMRGLRDTNRLADLAYGEKQQEIAGNNALSQLLAQGKSGADVTQGLAAQGYGKKGLDYGKSMLDQQKTQADIGNVTAQASMNTSHGKLFSAQADKSVTDQKYDAALHHAQGLAYVNTPQDVSAYIDQGITKGVFPAEMRDQMLQKAASYPSIAEWKKASEQGAISVLDKYKTQAEAERNAATNATSIATNKLTNETSRANNASSNATTMRGQNMTDARTREFNATKVEENNIKRSAKDEEKNLTKNSQIASFDTMLGTLDRLSKHSGLPRSVGVIGAMPTIPGSDSANFQAELNTFQSQAFLPMVAQLKGMGALSDAEGKKLTAAVGALDPKMGEAAFRESITRITEDMDAARTRMTGKARNAQTSAPKAIKSDADYAALPSGATFVGPDGKTRRKP